MLIKKLTTSQYQLITATGVSEGALSDLQPLLSEGMLTLVLSAESCTLTQVAYEDHERKLLDKVIPYSLEDDIAERVDDLHFSINRLSDKTTHSLNTALVCYVNKELLAAELQHFDENNIALHACVSEISLLPWQEGQWTLVFADQHKCLIRCADGEGISCDRKNLELVLQALLREKLLPEKIRIYVAANAVMPEAQALLKALPGFDVKNLEFIQREYWQLLAQRESNGKMKSAEPETASYVNLLTGKFAPKLPWDKWWQQWKIAAMLIIAIGLIDLSARALEIQKLESANQRVVTEIENSFRQLIPEGALVDPRLQLQRRLESLRGNSGSGFIALLDKAAPVIMNNPDLEIQNLNYSEQDREIQLILITRDFNAAESVRARLQSLGLQAELIGSTSSVEGNRSRLSIGS